MAQKKYRKPGFERTLGANSIIDMIAGPIKQQVQNKPEFSYPPANCDDAKKKISALRDAIAQNQASYDQSHSNAVGIIIGALSEQLQKHTEYVNNNCLVSQTSGSGSSSDASTTTTNATTSSSNSNISAPGASSSPLATLKKVPKWAYFAGGGLVLVLVVVLIVKK